MGAAVNTGPPPLTIPPVIRILDFDTDYRREDRWLRFTIRLSLVLFLLAIEVAIVLAFGKLLLFW